MSDTFHVSAFIATVAVNEGVADKFDVNGDIHFTHQGRAMVAGDTEQGRDGLNVAVSC
ncbi:hypothetical protein [Erwinia psidii]|uniref:hypothetical protein n=1 Tax=Erwinia psidii TaxID=69224 RepID=UPI00226B77B2|nr:hypothetical protein [Erwinia psidii]